MNLQGGNEFCDASLGRTPSPSILKQIALSQENVPFTKKELVESFEETGRVMSICLPSLV